MVLLHQMLRLLTGWMKACSKYINVCSVLVMNPNLICVSSHLTSHFLYVVAPSPAGGTTMKQSSTSDVSPSLTHEQQSWLGSGLEYLNRCLVDNLPLWCGAWPVWFVHNTSGMEVLAARIQLRWHPKDIDCFLKLHIKTFKSEPLCTTGKMMLLIKHEKACSKEEGEARAETLSSNRQWQDNILVLSGKILLTNPYPLFHYHG